MNFENRQYEFDVDWRLVEKSLAKLSDRLFSDSVSRFLKETEKPKKPLPSWIASMLWAVGFLILIYAGVLLFRLNQQSEVSWWGYVLAFFLGLGVSLSIQYVGATKVNRRIAKCAAGPARMKVRPTGLDFKFKHSRIQIDWLSVASVDDIEGGVSIFFGDAVLTIPTSAFECIDEQRSFIQFLNEKCPILSVSKASE